MNIKMAAHCAAFLLPGGIFYLAGGFASGCPPLSAPAPVSDDAGAAVALERHRRDLAVVSRAQEGQERAGGNDDRGREREEHQPADGLIALHVEHPSCEGHTTCSRVKPA
ncbi:MULTISPECIES: hypothetical protein [unclassified Bradyrhizobium]|uniref:hypothetical protein n=1 Tax=unclassified Bradyrhizobium TaxID=2631580 RepID=UPI0028EC1F38|nr:MULTISPECIES: hypothetical protein [unclassified Bradyrhizobium]